MDALLPDESVASASAEAGVTCSVWGRHCSVPQKVPLLKPVHEHFPEQLGLDLGQVA